MTLSSKKCPTPLKLDRKKCLRVLGRVQTLSEPILSRSNLIMKLRYEYEYIDTTNEFDDDFGVKDFGSSFQRDEDKRFKRRPDTDFTAW